MTDRIDDIAGRLETVEGDLAADDTAARVDDLAGEISSLREQVSSLEASAATADAVAGVEESLSSLQARIDEVASQRAVTAEEAAADAALVLGIGRIAERLEAGEGFAEALAQVRLLADGRDAVNEAAQALDPYKGGVPSRAKLAASFGEVADAAARAGMGAQVDEGWLRRIVGRVSEVISVRPTGSDAEGGHPGAIVARAEAELSADNLAGAVAEIERLSGGAAEAAAGWLQAAKDRLAAEAALKRLSQASLEALSNSGSEG